MAKKPPKTVNCIKCGMQFDNPMPYSDFDRWQCKKCAEIEEKKIEIISVKQCRKCKCLKPYSEFTIRNHNICKECVKSYDKRKRPIATSCKNN